MLTSNSTTSIHSTLKFDPPTPRGDTPYIGLYREAPPERDAFLKL